MFLSDPHMQLSIARKKLNWKKRSRPQLTRVSRPKIFWRIYKLRLKLTLQKKSALTLLKSRFQKTKPLHKSFPQALAYQNNIKVLHQYDELDDLGDIVWEA